ncbi:MAG TPA: hypothetical protein VMF51_21380 [Nocardioides sp.]|uniref:hypothetical protein n=1 Tax=Nocardioides sp. TaxID=35761 RepID=UPI002C93058E|nr:hypothetical protein [Nocardioides sp.]HTW17693.1 hypothetical protein [Nocardioides sp.]
MKRAVVPLLAVLLGAWLVADPRGLADAAGASRDRAWEATGEVLSSAVTFVGER